MTKKKSTITIKDLASYVGLSVGTVSMALNDSDKIATQTKKIVKQAAKEIGFKKNPFARSLSTQSSKIIGCTVPDLTNNFYGEMIYHLQEDLEKLGYGLIVGCSNESSTQETKLIQQFIDKGVDGIITVPVSDINPDLIEIESLVNNDFPIVFISSYYRLIPQYTVMCNLEDGMYQLTKKMIEQGHRNIVIVSGKKKLIPSGNRINGFKRAMADCGLSVSDSNFLETSEVTFLGGYSAISKAYFQRKPDLVIAINDIMAMGIISNLKSQKVRIPEDVSVAGFDDISISEFQETPLTTVSQNLDKMSKEAVDLLMKRIKGQSKGFGVERVPASIVIRRSTKEL